LYYKTDTLTTPTTFLKKCEKTIGSYIKGRRKYAFIRNVNKCPITLIKKINIKNLLYKVLVKSKMFNL